MSPDLRSSNYRGLREEMAFFLFSKTTKGMLEKESSGRTTQRQRRGKVSRANRLSSEPPRAGSPGSALLHSTATPANSGPHCRRPGTGTPDGQVPKGPACSCSSMAWPLRPAAQRGSKPPEWRVAARPGRLPGGRVAGSRAVRFRPVAWLHSVVLLMCIQVE